MITKNCKYCDVEFKQYGSGPMLESVKDDILNDEVMKTRQELFIREVKGTHDMIEVLQSSKMKEEDNDE